MTVFGFFWLGWAVTVAERNPAVAWPALYGGFLVLLAVTIPGVRRGKALVNLHGAHDATWRLARGPFHAIAALEAAGCALAVILALAWHRPELVAAGISLVVGLHFLPLARWFRVPLYYVVGTAIIVCDILAWVLLRSSAITVSVGFTTGLILWTVAVYGLLRSRRLVRAYPPGGRGPATRP